MERYVNWGITQVMVIGAVNCPEGNVIVSVLRLGNKGRISKSISSFKSSASSDSNGYVFPGSMVIAWEICKCLRLGRQEMMDPNS